jgi:hypothetical protein
MADVHIHIKGEVFARKFEEKVAESSPDIQGASGQGLGKTFCCHLYPDQDMELSEVPSGPHFADHSAGGDGSQDLPVSCARSIQEARCKVWTQGT